MRCKICSEKYDHSKHQPIVLIPCTHTLCVKCFGRLEDTKECPFCYKRVVDKNPNWSMLELIPESSYDIARLKLEQCLNETTNLKNLLEENYESKRKENLNDFQLIRNQIIWRTNEMIKSIQRCQKLLLADVRKYENKAKCDLDKIMFDESLNTDLAKAKEVLEKNEADLLELEKLRNEFTSRSLDLNSKLIDCEKCNDYKFEFVPNKEITLDLKAIGTLKALKIQKNEVGAITRYLKTIELNKLSNIELFLEKALAFEKMKDYDSALALYTKATELEPLNHRAFYLKGKCLQAKKELQEAIVCFEQAIQLKPDETIYYCFKGLCLRERKELIAAIECFNKAIQTDPMNSDAYFGKGLALVARKNYSRAINCYNKALELNPNEFDYLNRKADALYCLQDYKGATNCLIKSLSIDQKINDYAYNLRGIIAFAQKNYDESIEYFNKAIETSGSITNRANYLFNKGYAYFKKEDFKSASDNFKLANELNPIMNFSYYDKFVTLDLFRQ